MLGISKQFGPVQALTDVTFTVRKGTVHALCGENGAEKSTLMKILAGVHRPDSGTIELNGNSLQFSKPHDAIVAGISMIYQELDLAEDLTVAENIFLGAEPGVFAIYPEPRRHRRGNRRACRGLWILGQGQCRRSQSFHGRLPDCGTAEGLAAQIQHYRHGRADFLFLGGGSEAIV